MEFDGGRHVDVDLVEFFIPGTVRFISNVNTVPFHNRGDVVSQAGVLRFNTATTHYDGSSLAGPAAVDLAAATQTIEAGTSEAAGANVTFFGTSLTGPGDLRVTGVPNWLAGTLQGTGTITVAPGGTLDIEGSAARTLSRHVVNNCNTNWPGSQLTFNGGTFHNNGRFNATSVASGGPISALGAGTHAVFNNAGTFAKRENGSASFAANPTVVTFNNTGTVEVTAGTVNLFSVVSQYAAATNTLAGGTWILQANSTLFFPAAATVRTSAADVTLEGASSLFPTITSLTTVAAGGRFALAGGRDFAATPTGSTFTNRHARAGRRQHALHNRRLRRLHAPWSRP